MNGKAGREGRADGRRRVAAAADGERERVSRRKDERGAEAEHAEPLSPER